MKTLESHFINSEAYRYIKENNFEGFIKERNKLLVSINALLQVIIFKIDGYFQCT